MTNNTKTSSLITLISVFFFWGFVAASNSVLIPLFRKHFDLLQWQSQLVDFAFYIAYTVGSLMYFFISYTSGDPLNKIGYKKGLVIGLLISAVGALGFVPAAAAKSYPLFLTAYFVVGFGFALQQIVANPYMIALGDPATGSHRVSLAGGINSFGTAIGPLLLSFAIYGNLAQHGDVGLEAVKFPYIILFFMFVVFAAILGFSKLPPVTNPEKIEGDLGAFKHPQILWGMLAIFVYVGVEVTIQSNMPALMEKKDILNLDHTKTVHFISLFWGCLMVGRWRGGLAVFNLAASTRKILMALVPVIAYAVVLGVNYINMGAQGTIDRFSDLYEFWPMIVLIIIAFFIANEKPARTMILFGAMAALLMVVGLFTTGKIALYAFVSGGLFCSVMWPCIFSLSIAGLGKYTSQGSSLLIMMIAGGAAIPPLQGMICDLDKVGNMQNGIMGISWTHFSYIIPALGFAYLSFYGWKVKSVLLSQGIDYDNEAVKAIH